MSTYTMGDFGYVLASYWLSRGCTGDGLKICHLKQSYGAIRHKTDPVPQKARAALVKMADMSSGHCRRIFVYTFYLINIIMLIPI